MKFCIVASGSKGNMTYIETKEAKILLDAGISLKEATKRVDIDFMALDAIIISHEHSDHINNLVTIAKKTNACVYINKGSFDVIAQRYKEKLLGIEVKFLEPNTKYTIKDLNILTLRLSHDSISCLGFIFHSEKESLGYVTDTGFLPLPYIELLKRVDSLVIEANHDIEMLNNSDRPWILKERILSIKGHMSNYICGQILNSIVSAHKVKVVVLAHLSEECNKEELAVDTVLNAIEGDYLPKIMIAKQHQALEFIEVA